MASPLPVPGVRPDAAPETGLQLARAGRADLKQLRAMAAACQACELWERATQTVFGEGRTGGLMLIGEQPGDQEDRQGHPFVGPAGRVLDEALETAHIDRERVFLTNVVKHFRWRPVAGSKRRLHERPGREHIEACLPWVEAEIALLRPAGIVLLGATAAAALAGPDIRVTRDHGQPIDSPFARIMLATIHPSAVLRADRGGRARAMETLTGDLRQAAALMGQARAEGALDPA